ncbi:MAG: dimethyl sulfoxide reductase anchor subunit [Hyphomicrobiaceae bacterium]|nr:dimethyl sulfoxide reductase anchor subunit [Hyphomicrobiaceae bacterium]
MHPAYSVIFFTTASGAGLGLIVWLGLANLLGLLPAMPSFGYFTVLVALGLLSIGLLSSTFHLGRPERAWRAFSQWRSSWLSREGLAASATYLPTLAFAIGWDRLGDNSGYVALAGAVAALLALVTLYTTGMIYASLPTIRAWNQPLTAPAYIVLGLASGAVLMALMLAVFDYVPTWAVWLAITSLAAGWVIKRLYWRKIDSDKPRHTVGQATGLGGLGQVRPLDPPHTMPNFVMREMGFEVGRKHACKLRHFAVVLAFVVPAVLVVLMLAGGSVINIILAVLAVMSAAAGLVMERWLFFAEAEHVSMLYYGREAA